MGVTRGIRIGRSTPNLRVKTFILTPKWPSSTVARLPCDLLKSDEESGCYPVLKRNLSRLARTQMVAETAEGACARCQALTTKKCTGCFRAPAYDEVVARSTFYCSIKCQGDNWNQHKSECKQLQARRALGRAALLLQAIFYRIRLQASPVQFKKLHTAGSVLTMEGFAPKLLDTGRQLLPFPACPNIDQARIDAALVHMGCMEAMMYLHSFASELLVGKMDSMFNNLLSATCSLIKFPGLSYKIEDVSGTVTPTLQIFTIYPNAIRVNAPDPFYHNLYRVTLKNGEIWALDTTGAQCGWPDPLRPWREFVRERGCRTMREENFGYIRQRFYQSSRESRYRYMAAQMMEKEELGKALDAKISSWAEERGGKLDVILKGSNESFEIAKNRFLADVEDHLKVSITKLYSSEQILRRDDKVDCQILQNSSAG